MWSFNASVLSKNFNRLHSEIFFLIFLKNWLGQFMQIVSYEDNLHGTSKPIFLDKIRKISI